MPLPPLQAQHEVCYVGGGSCRRRSPLGSGSYTILQMRVWFLRMNQVNENVNVGYA